MSISPSLNRIVCVNLDIRIWSGQKKLRPEDLNLSKEQQIPQSVASLGVKKVCDPKQLKTFLNIRRAAERECMAVGVKFLGGYAIPQVDTAGLSNRLDELKERFNELKANFLSDYEFRCEQWIETLPQDWQHIVKEAIQDKDSVSNSLKFNYQTFKVDEIDGLNTGLEKEVNTLEDRLFKDIRDMATHSYKTSFEGRSESSQRALRPLKHIQKKLNGLYFLSDDIHTIQSGLQSLFDQLPMSGPITGIYRSMVVGELERLMRVGIPDRPPEPEQLPAYEETSEAPQEENLEEGQWF